MSDEEYRSPASPYGGHSPSASPYGGYVAPAHSNPASGSPPRTVIIEEGYFPPRESTSKDDDVLTVLLLLGLTGSIVGGVSSIYYGFTHNESAQMVFLYSSCGCLGGFPILLILAGIAFIFIAPLQLIWEKWFWRHEPKQAVLLFTTVVFAVMLSTLLKKNSAVSAGAIGLFVHSSCMYIFHKFRQWFRYSIFSK